MKKNIPYRKIDLILVEDDEGLCNLISRRLKKLGSEIFTFNRGLEALDFIKLRKDFLLILDYNLPDISGFELINEINKFRGKTDFIIITGYADINKAVEVMKGGARDYIVKDSNFLEVIPTIVEKVLSEINTEFQLEHTQKELESTVEQVRIFESFANSTRQGFVMTGLNGKINYVNPALLKLLGFDSEDEIKGKKLLQFYPEIYHREIVSEILPEVLENEVWIGELELCSKNGPVVNCMQNIFLIRDKNNEPLYIASLVTDITEKKQSEEILHLQSEALEAAANAMVITNIKGDIVWSNKAFSQLTGYSKREVMYKNISILNSGEHPVEFYQKMWNTILAGKVWHSELINKKKNGQKYFEEQIITPVYNRNSEISYFIAVKLDITERKLIEEEKKRINEELEKRVEERTKELKRINEALHDSEEQYRTLFESSTDALILVDDYIITEVNPSAVELFGCKSKDELIGKSVFQFSPQYQDNGEKSSKLLRKYYENAYINGSEKFTWVNLKYHGEKFYSDIWLTSLTIKKKRIIQAVIRDITEKLKAEQELKLAQSQLVESERMASIGEMVAGVSHEINTPIGIGVTAASYLVEKTDEISQKVLKGEIYKSELENYFETARMTSESILYNLKRAADLVKSYKQVAVDQSHDELRYFNIKLYINDILNSLKPKLKKTKHNVRVFCKQDIEVRTYPGAFSQILTNLIINSLLHGFENIESGLITITIELKENRLFINYKDNGVGIPEENLSKIFNPFFTTKRGHGGSGLGLHIIYNIVKQKLKGELKVKSKPDNGVEFDINFKVETK